MATIKLEIFLDSNEQTDVLAFSNLMNAFSGAPSVQYLSSGFSGVENVTIGCFKKESDYKAAIDAGVRSETNTDLVKVTTEATKEEEYQNGYEYSEAEMMKLPNTDLKDYATSLGIDWAKAEGKNTNRKLADLVLAYRNEEAKEQETPTDEEVKDEAPTETTEDLTKEEDLAGDKLTYNDLKVSLGKKVDEHREAIVAKLAEYGATKMPNLAEEHWTDMFNFMEAL